MLDGMMGMGHGSMVIWSLIGILIIILLVVLIIRQLK